MNNTYGVHAPLDVMTIWVKQDIFYDLETNTDEWVKCKLFGLTCIKDRVPTFEIMTEDGYVFSDIPPHMIRWQLTDDVQFDLKDLVYNNCLSEQFCISEFPELKARYAFVFLKEQKQYIKGSYWYSLDFYQNNNWYHCIKLDNGQIAFMPSHKIVLSVQDKLSEQHVFPQYKKLRHVFTV